MIVITGAAGFIASYLAQELNQKGFTDVILVDDFSNEKKNSNHQKISCSQKINRDVFFTWYKENKPKIDVIFHLGARTDTTEMNYEVHNQLNVQYSKLIWKLCTEIKIPLIYASSAATYGLGEHGYQDSHDIVKKLKPLNPYGESKNNFDNWALEQTEHPPYWAGMKFFNVYGPNESHKGRMASVVFHAYHQIKESGQMKLFRSHNPEYKDGDQLRDFIYVKDVISICLFLYENQIESGLYNVGTGKARSFKDLAENTFKALHIESNITYIDTPLDIRDKYQYFTEADMNKLHSIGYNKPFYTLEEGIKDYIQYHLNA